MNRLSEETSPYLLQHADNPVDWFAWGPEAFEAARSASKPILLSVGYSACHWCHVMAHESFEDDATAELMNKFFVNIKVDREERPDIDAIYMQALTSMAGHGGWPMTVFLTPEGEPFYAGTYFPKEPRENMPSFKDVLEAINNSWGNERANVQERASQITSALQAAQNMQHTSSARASDGGVDGGVYYRQTALSRLRMAHDPAWGGFGNAPKFPQTMALEFLVANMDDDDVAMAVKTSLDAMASGGIYDHLGGGFSRYSTDTFWLVPHFEKMLYDNALLMRLYLYAYQRTLKPRYLQVVTETAAYVLRDLYDPKAKAFYAAEDADSEGEEGLFYVWEFADFMETLAGGQEKPEPREVEKEEPKEVEKHGEEPNIAELAGQWYGLSEEGNFSGKNILYRRTRGDLLRSPDIEKARQSLFEARQKRIRPSRDEKILTEWNGLMIAALAESAFVLHKTDWLVAAKDAGEFLYNNLRQAGETNQAGEPNDRWLRSFAMGQAKHPGCAHDYAQVVNAFTRLYEASAELVWLKRACEVADGLLELFWDDTEGGLFTTGKDFTDTIIRAKDITDNAIPSANSAATISLMRLGALTGNGVYAQRAHEILDLCAGIAAQNPLAFGNFLCALSMREAGLVEIVIPTETTSQDNPYIQELRGRYLPNAVLAWGPPPASDLFTDLWEGKEIGKAYICRNYVCMEPADSVEAFASQLDELAS